MSSRSRWRLEREGFTIDSIVRFLRDTAFNPLPTVPLYLAALYHCGGRNSAIEASTAIGWLEKLVILGLLRKANAFLNKGTFNNWVGDKYDWNEEIVLVTGGSDGIGARVVQMLAQRGIKVVVLDIQPLKYVACPLIHYYQCDISSPSSIKSVGNAIRAQVGNPTIVVSNAGLIRAKSILETTQSDLDVTFDINTKAQYYIAQEFLPHMIEQDHGMFATIVSIAAYISFAQLSSYAASKAATLAFHEGLQAELATVYKAPRVRTVAVCPTFTKTALFTGADQGNGFTAYHLEVDTVAEAVVRAVLRGRSDHIVLPLSLGIITGVRNWPWWLQTIHRKDLNGVMARFRGRQVSQPSEVKIEGMMDSDLIMEK